MRTFHRFAVTAALTVLTAGVETSPALAQVATKIAGRDVQVHGSFQQGFVLTSANNFLTMNTSKGSTEMTDGAINVSSGLTRKLRVGAQLYSRNIGQLGKGSPQFDWAYADYRFAKWIGVRGGKMKTALGLFNDTQDMEFLYTWAVLPQGVYPLDLRSVTIAHVGGDVYGDVSLKKAGSLSYTAHYGAIPDDANGGYRYGVVDGGTKIDGDISARGFGVDVRWTAPIDGLVAGYSLMSSKADTHVLAQVAPNFYLPLGVEVRPWRRNAVFADYQRDALRLSAEVRNDLRGHRFTPQLRPDEQFESRGWLLAGSYRLSKRIEAGSYVTNYVPDLAANASLPTNHEADVAVTARVDLNRFWHVKVEGHFMDGYGSLNDSFTRGFYMRDNSQPTSTTHMLVVRTGFNF